MRRRFTVLGLCWRSGERCCLGCCSVRGGDCKTDDLLLWYPRPQNQGSPPHAIKVIAWGLRTRGTLASWWKQRKQKQLLHSIIDKKSGRGEGFGNEVADLLVDVRGADEEGRLEALNAELLRVGRVGPCDFYAHFGGGAGVSGDGDAGRTGLLLEHADMGGRDFVESRRRVRHILSFQFKWLMLVFTVSTWSGMAVKL